MAEPTEIHVTPDDLIAFAWSAPMRDLAIKVGISDVGLKKLLRGHGIVLPPQGHWNRVHAGRKVTDRPLASARGPGCSDRIRLDPRFFGLITDAGLFPADGPFASSLVPESLESLRAAARAKISRISVPQLTSSHHPSLEDLIKREARRREKHLRDRWAEAPHFDTPYWQRQIRLFNALFLALARHGGGGSLNEDDRRLVAHARVGETGVSIALEPVGKVRTELRGGSYRPAPDLPARTRLALSIDAGQRREPFARHADDDVGTLERKLPEIVADIVTACEAAFRRGLREQQEWLEQFERLRVEAEARKRAVAEKARAERLAAHAAELREADEIRALVARASETGSADPVALAAWSRWALARADLVDPIKSGALFAELLSLPAAHRGETSSR